MSLFTVIADPVERRDQDRGGKTPCSAMQKDIVRLGIMLLCGACPPADASTWLAMATTLAEAGANACPLFARASEFPAGVLLIARALCAIME